MKYIKEKLEKIDSLKLEIEEEKRSVENFLVENFLRDYRNVRPTLYVDREDYEVQLFSCDDIQKITGEFPEIKRRDCELFPYYAYAFFDGIKYFTVLDEEEYKKATAPTVTKKSFDTL